MDSSYLFLLYLIYFWFYPCSAALRGFNTSAPQRNKKKHKAFNIEERFSILQEVFILKSTNVIALHFFAEHWSSEMKAVLQYMHTIMGKKMEK